MTEIRTAADESVPFDFLTRIPGAPLDGLVESIWFARGTVPYTRERIAPTGSTVAVIVLGDPIRQTPDDGRGEAITSSTGLLIGPHDRPTVNEPLGETHAVGVVTTAVGCEAVFGVPADSVRRRVAELSSIWPVTEALRTDLLASADDPVVMLDRVEAALVEHRGPAVAGLERCRAAVTMLENDPARPVAEIATELGVSHGHLDREFTRVVGLSPRALSKLLRMRRLLDLIDVQGDIDWSNHAATLGWFDQAHLIRDFKRHTGVTPSHYVEAQRATYTTVEPGDAAGFVPEP